MNSKVAYFRYGLGIFLFFLTSFYLHGESEAKGKRRFVLIRDGKLNVRDSPNEGKVLFQLDRGSSVTVLGDEGEKWQKIQTKDGKQGFVATEFLAKYPPSKLKDMTVIGIVSAGKEDESAFRSLSIRVSGKWVSSDEFPSESSYLEKILVTDSKPFSVYRHGEKTGEFHPKKRGIGGCQEYPVVNGKFHPLKELSEERISYIGYTGDGFAEKVKLEQISPSAELSKILDGLADKALKNKFPPKKSAVQRDQMVLVKSSAHNYLFIRYSIRSEHEENAYYSALYEFSGDKPGKKIFEKSETLMSERAFYGGSFHLIDAFELPGIVDPVFLFFHNGYDGYIYEFYRIQDNLFRKMFLSGGDAC